MDKDKLLIESLIKSVKELTAKVQDMEAENKLLKAEIVELKAQINSNSHNSNKPPSSDGYQKRPAFTKTKRGKQGGQEGHNGKTLRQVSKPDNIIRCIPDNECPCCKHKNQYNDDDLVLSEKRQVLELPEPKLESTEYQIYTGICSKCGSEQKGTVPKGVNAPIQYGNNVKALAVLLNVYYKIPYKKVQLLFNDLFGYPLNESTIFQAGEICHEKLQESEKIIKSKISSNNVAHADETGLRVAGKLHWLHTATTELYTYLFVHQKRGAGALQSEQSILDKIKGWLVHDCWGSYFKFKQMKHAICGAHILRELQGLIENKNSKWANTLKIFLMNIYEMPFEKRVKWREHIESRYNLICTIGEKAEPPPMKTKGGKGRNKRTKGRNLVERLIREKEGVLAFAFNKEVPFTNNLAERDIRPAKVKQKISNCFRTFHGAEIYARIEGFISTARKNNRRVFFELCNTFAGYNFITNNYTGK